MMKSLIIFVVLFLYSMFITELYSLVVTKHDQRTLLDYHSLVRHYRGVEAEISFSQRNLVQYCTELRDSRIFKLPTMNDPIQLGHPNQRSLPHNMTAQSLAIERNQMGMQQVTFRIEHSRQTLPHQTFRCMDFDGELKWFITPAFIPDSAFLFLLGRTSTRDVALTPLGISRNNLVPAHLVAVIDESPVIQEANVSYVLSTSVRANNESGRDPLCDLSPMLQYRLCAITVQIIDALMNNTNIPAGMYEPTYQDRWFELEESRCRSVDFNIVFPPVFTQPQVTLDMLYCSSRSLSQSVMVMPFYLSLNTLDNSTVIPLVQVENPYMNTFITYNNGSNVEIPLLRHYQQYQQTVGNSL